MFNSKLKNKISNVLVGVLIISALAYLIGSFFKISFFLSYPKTVFILSMFLMYLLNRTKGDLFFGIFLFSLSAIEIIFYWYFYYQDPVSSTLLGVFSVAAYASLFNYLAFKIKFAVLLKKYVFHSIVSLIIGILAFKKLNQLLNFHDSMFNDLSFIVDLAYNIFIILIFVFSFLYYIHLKNKRSFILFISIQCIVISEFIDISSYYAHDLRILPILSSLVFVGGFYFIYLYITHKVSEVRVK